MLRQLILAAILLAYWLPFAAATPDVAQQRDLFLQTEALLQQNHLPEAEQKMQLLRDYPLYAALMYRKLQDRLWLQNEIEAFVNEFRDIHYADDLRRQWLRYLAANKQWPIFFRYYRQNNDAALQCLWRQAQYETGAVSEALQAARELWTVGHSQPEECNELFSALQNSQYLSEDLKWRRFELALQSGDTGLALHIKRLLDTLQQPVADFWLDVHQHPRLMEDASFRQKSADKAGIIFVHGVMRLADDDLEEALAIWEQRRQQFSIDQEHTDQTEKKLAMLLVRQKDSRAYDHLSRIASDGDETVREWRVRAALLEQDWQHVDTALQHLNAEEKRAPQWQYWQARALQETGKAQQADAIFKQLAEDRSFYGFLSADRSSLPYRLADRPALVAAKDLETIQQRRAFRMVEEFRALGRDSEATRQWWYAIGQLDNREKIVAAKLAQRWAWHHIAIFTLARTAYWDDLDLRFPLLYPEQIKSLALRHGLQPGLIYGLVRQESVFDPYAQSSAGARGLMQLMPETGKQIAGKLHDDWSSASLLYDPDTNLKYGTYYFKDLLDRFGGNAVLAAAGYNAGPQRVYNWRPDYRPVPADVWIETIPFKETRKYVSSVLTYSMIYQQRLGLSGLRLKDLIHDIAPDNQFLADLREKPAPVVSSGLITSR